MFDIWETLMVATNKVVYRCEINGSTIYPVDKTTLEDAMNRCPKGMTMRTHLFSGDWGSELLSDTINGHWWDNRRSWQL